MIRYTTDPHSPIVEVTVEGEITNRELISVFDRLREDLGLGGKTRVLEVIRDFSGMEPQALWTDLKLGVPLAQKITRVAVVADQAWIRAACHLGRYFTKAELKVYPPAELGEARAWIAQD